MKQGFIRGVLTCDPSWRGLAFTIHIPSLKYNESVVMDMSILLENKKTLTQPLTYTPLVVTCINLLLERRPFTRLCDKFVIETQFQENMKTLSHIIVGVMLTKLPHMRVEKLSALTCKRKHSVPYGQGQNNKKNMLEYVSNNKDKLIAGDTVKDHNTADSIILLNTWLSLKKRHLYQDVEQYTTPMESELHFDVPFELKHTWWTCPICKYDTGKMYLCKNPPKDPARKDMRGTFFMSCRNKTCNAGPSYLGKKPPAIINEAIGNASVGVWKRSNGCNKPPEEQSAIVDGTFSTVPVTALGKREKDFEYEEGPPSKKKAIDNILSGLVDALEQKQDALEKKVLEIQSKTDESLSKLLLAITGGGVVVPEEKKEKKNKRETRKEATLSRINQIKRDNGKKFDVEKLEDVENVDVL